MQEENPFQPLRKALWNSEPIAFVNKVIAVASGKGGVGKSTTAVNLAFALAKSGNKVGLLDADIYGPSLPKMLGINQKPEIVDNKIIPLQTHGLKCLSMGFLVEEDAAIIWRGPQVTKALQQMLRDTLWATAEDKLDYLIIDLPPGTGDIHLSLVQKAPLTGAVIVTTPQEIALIDAKKAIDMFERVSVPILGIIENMSGFKDDSGKIHRIFGEGGGRKLAGVKKVQFLGEVPLDINLRIAGDNGTQYADGAEIYKNIAKFL